MTARPTTVPTASGDQGGGETPAAPIKRGRRDVAATSGRTAKQKPARPSDRVRGSEVQHGRINPCGLSDGIEL